MREDLKRELLRKSLHIIGISIPMVYLFFERDFTILYISLLIISSIFIELLRIRAPILFPINKVIEGISRKYEKTALASYVYFFMAALVVTFLFSMEAVIIGLTTALVGDAMAAILGRIIGKHNIRNKTIEGNLTGMITVIVISFPLTKNLIISIMLGVCFSILDLIDFRFDDNFVLPFGMSLMYELLEAIL
ncbi:MAG: hypothetical protein NZ922_01070 [Candidatus Methanomethyliaceae archaeon]|nr:hypothetical protein [Candidatus Methanomethyliaceae archaeon]MDW7970234.1 hypothetical protein [Nitrososphaerota archaeon]